MPPAGGAAGHLSLRGLVKSYDGRANAVDGVSLEIARGEFVTLLGPSGSGKTTTLMMIAGFEEPTAGAIVLDGEPLTGTPPYRRNIGVVFQSYALFPHMTARRNVEFPLLMRRVDQARMRERVDRALDLVGLGAVAHHHPRQLSGGQQQRVALARALVFEPGLLLLDEPLGALDKNLREQMQVEIKRIQREIGITTALRDPRPDGGHDDVGPRRGLQPRAGGAIGAAARRVLAAGHALRRGVPGGQQRAGRHGGGPAASGSTAWRRRSR